MGVKSDNTKKQKLVPPDGGYAYVICFACILMLAPTAGFRSSFSLMYHDLMTEIGMDGAKIGLVAGCNVMSLSITGFLTGPLLKVFSLRRLALLASIMFNLGAFCSALSQSVTMFIFCQALLQAPTGGFRSSFSLMYHDLMTEIGMDGAKIGLVAGCNVMSLSITGFLTGPLLKVFSLRKLALLAIIMFNLGAFCSALSQSVTMFIFCQALLQNAGFGILYNLVFTSMKEFFSKKRLMAVSLVQTANAIASVCVPFLIKGATDYFGHRGMLIIISGISIQSFIGVSLLQPLAWHMKKEEILEEEEEEEEIKSSATKASKTSRNNGKVKNNANASEPHSIKQTLKGLINVKLLKEFGLSRTCLGLSTIFVADFLYSLMLTRAFYSRGMSREFVASSMSLIATGDLMMRILFTLFSARMKKLGNRELYAFGTLLAFLARSGMLLSSSKTLILVFMTITGIARSFGNTLIPVVIADTVPPENYSASLGIAMLIMGVINLSLSPLAGAIQDYMNNYDLVLWFISFLFLGVTVLFAIEIKVHKEKEKKK